MLFDATRTTCNCIPVDEEWDMCEGVMYVILPCVVKNRISEIRHVSSLKTFCEINAAVNL